MTDNPYRYPYVPIGGIIEWDGTGLTGAPDLSTPEKVAAVYGYGTWERYGTDRVTVGAGSDYKAGATGGEKEHKLVIGEIPYHDHDQYGITSDGNANRVVYKDKTGDFSGGYAATINWITDKEKLTTGGCGNSKAHNNMPPYISTYRYRRIK